MANKIVTEIGPVAVVIVTAGCSAGQEACKALTPQGQHSRPVRITQRGMVVHGAMRVKGTERMLLAGGKEGEQVSLL